MRRGFTLIELSIVLVIIGLIVGGVLVGQELIRGAERRRVISDVHRYNTAVNAFRLKYNCLPGDCSNATSFWGMAAVGGACATTVNGSATCNGDGDKFIEIASSTSREAYRFWQQLSNAGLIEGSYTGIPANVAWTWGATPGVNGPVGPIAGSGFAVLDRSYVGGWYNDIFEANGNNWFQFGRVWSNAMLGSPALVARDAFDIDTKIDDGRPGTGQLTTFNHSRYANCADSDTASTAVYQVTNSNLACVMFFSIQ